MLKQAYDPARFRDLGHQLVDQLADYLKQAQAGQAMNVLPYPDPDAERHFWQRHWAEGTDANLPALWQTVLDRSHHLHHPHYVGHQVSVPAMEPVLTSMLTALLNNGMAVYEMGPVASALEQLIMREVGLGLGYGDSCEGIMTSGGTLANLTALLCARKHIPAADVWQTGTDQQYCLFVSAQAHYCVDRAVRIMGWGADGIIKVPVDEQFRMRTDLLPEMIATARAEGKIAIAVVGSACSTATGSYDDLAAIAEVAQAQGLWFHVDGAHGAAAAFSEQFGPLVAGIELADSVTLDFHKMMTVPALATGLVFKEGRTSYRTFAQEASYLWAEQEEPEWFNFGKRTFECTKRMVSVQVYSLLYTYGFKVVKELVDKTYQLARDFAALINKEPDFELAIEPQANIVCFRYQTAGVSGEKRDTLNRRIREAVLRQEQFYLVQTQLPQGLFLRTTLMHPFTEIKHLKRLLDQIRQLGETLLYEPSLHNV